MKLPLSPVVRGFPQARILRWRSKSTWVLAAVSATFAHRFNPPDTPLGFLHHTMAILVIGTIVNFRTVAHLTAVTALKQIDSALVPAARVGTRVYESSRRSPGSAASRSRISITSRLKSWNASRAAVA